MGLLGPDEMHFDAVGQKGHEYRLDLARGDRVRLFQRAKATFASGAGGIIGSNGAVLEILALDKQGTDIRDEKSGKEARIAWESLRTSSGRIHLAYGDCRTIASAQGMTADSVILSLPSGSHAVDGNSAYSAGSRHREWLRIITSEDAEYAEVKQSRTLDDTRPVTLDDKWGNVGRHFANQVKKDIALKLFDRAAKVYRGSVMGFAQKMQPFEQRAVRRETAAFVHEKHRERQTASAARMYSESIQELLRRVAPMQKDAPRARQSQGPRQGTSF
jgi:hypothetical protein